MDSVVPTPDFDAELLIIQFVVDLNLIQMTMQYLLQTNLAKEIYFVSNQTPME